MNGFIKLHRKIAKWEWYQDANTFRLFVHLLLIANHEDKRWQGKEVKRGQTITGRKALSKSLKLSQQQIRTSLNKLKSTSEITIKATNKFSLITLTHYDSYQSRDQIATNKTTSYAHNGQPTSNHKQELKELKEVKDKGKKWQIPDSINPESWVEFEQHRKEIKKPLSDLARNKAVKELQDFTFAEQASAINKSIQSRWAGVFPSKLNGGKNEAHQQTGNLSNHARVCQTLQAQIRNSR